MRYQLIIFDWEGTLVDPNRGFTMPRTEGVFPGVMDVLKQLKTSGVKLAIATGRGRRSLNWELSELHLKDLFDCTRTADETSPKPDPAMLVEILSELDVEASNAIMVGDSPVDLAMAAAARMDAIGVCYGTHTKAQLMAYPAKIYLDDIMQLIDFLKPLKN